MFMQRTRSGGAAHLLLVQFESGLLALGDSVP